MRAKRLKNEEERRGRTWNPVENGRLYPGRDDDDQPLETGKRHFRPGGTAR